MSINNISNNNQVIVNFHLVLPQKKLKLIKRIAKNKKISMSKLIRDIFFQYRLQIQNKQLFSSPKKTKKRNKIKNKVETRVNIFRQDYDFLTQNQLLNNYSSRAEFFREIIFDYLDELIDCGKQWFEEKLQKSKNQIENKFKIMKKNRGIIHKLNFNFEHLYNLRTNGLTVYDIEFIN